MNDKENIALIGAVKELRSAIISCRFLASKEDNELTRAIDESIHISSVLLDSIDTTRMA